MLHLHEPLAPSITVPALLAHPAPVVGTFHAAGDRTPYRWLGASLRRLADRIDARVAVSEAAVQLARRHLGGSYELLFNGIDVDRFRGRTAGRAPTARRSSSSGVTNPARDSTCCSTRFRHCPPRSPSGSPVTAPPPAGSANVTATTRRISWLGRLSEADKISHLRAASVLCAPSRHGESFGMVLLEAMAAGTPAVASDVPGYRSLSDQGGAVFLVPPGDPRALAGGLLRVLSERSTRRAPACPWRRARSALLDGRAGPPLRRDLRPCQRRTRAGRAPLPACAPFMRRLAATAEATARPAAAELVRISFEPLDGTRRDPCPRPAAMSYPTRSWS